MVELPISQLFVEEAMVYLATYLEGEGSTSALVVALALLPYYYTYYSPMVMVSSVIFCDNLLISAAYFCRGTAASADVM
jgi:Mg2+/citrate symporter